MGLRLYQAPVESDIQSKPAAEKTSAQARSSIRRREQYRSSNLAPAQALARERRRRLAAAAAAASSGQPFHPSVFYGESNRSPQPDAPVEPSATTDSSASAAAPDNGRRALRNMAARLGVLDDRVVALFGERWAHLHGETSPSRDDEDNNPSPLSIMAVEPEFLPRRRLPSVTEPYATSSIRSTQAPGHPSRSSNRPAGSYVRRRWADNLRDSPRPPAPRPRGQQREQREFPWETYAFNERLSTERTATFDGLGDRNRSLSPEGDNVWDTLLTTLTPDPQPPSVGSSFASASASASAAASQGAATGSSRTSFAGPDTAEESSFEPPCESGCENSDTEGEGDEDDEMDQNPLTRFPSDLRSERRSYADVTRSIDEHPLEMLGGIGGMQRIVSNLARREDIPDEWWAEAGLSRTLSREASSS